jgi:lysophospholipase L1-like esterase
MRGTLRTLLFSMTPLVVLLLILEIVGRAIYPFDADARARIQAERDPRVSLAHFSGSVDGKGILRDVNGAQKRYVPFLGFMLAPDQVLPTLRSNSLGFRDEPVAPRQAGEYRVLLLGGSTVWGLGASSNETIISRTLEKLLNEGAGTRRYRVMNGAYVGYTARQEMVVLTEFREQFDPDLVISVTGYNDVFTILRDRAAITQRPEARILADAVDAQLQPVGSLQALRKFAGSLGVWRLVVYFRELGELRSPSSTTVGYDAERGRRIAARVADTHLTMAEFTLRHGGQYVIALQPEIYTTGKQLTADEARAKARFTAAFKGIPEVYAQYRADLAAALASAPGLRIVDLGRALDGTAEPVFIDDCHFVDRGYYLIASALRDLVRAE